MARILIVDDEKNMRRMLRALLEDADFEVHEAGGGGETRAACERLEPDVVLMDLVMPSGPDGIAVLEQLSDAQCEPVVVMMSGKATLEDAVRATKLGAFQFLEKPLTPEGVVATVTAAAELARTRAENRALRAELPVAPDIVGASAAMRAVRELISRVAPTPARVLISGESGTGKELVARAIHRASTRADRPMITVNCAAVPRELLESEMFGHERGAFTGAVARHIGRFELADRSTLFLDEVGDMHPELQAKLLRVLEHGTIERVGAEREKPVDVRVIAATNRDLERAAAAGEFRLDLFHRLNVFPIAVAPLRERRDDVPDLIAHFSELAGRRSARPPRSFPPEAIERLQRHDWPGNVRELANTVERLTIIGGVEPVTVAEIDTVLGPERSGATPASAAPREESLTEALDGYESRLISAALEAAGGKVAEAARILKTDRANLYRRMRRLGLRQNDTGVSE
ncbi:MAG: sigma-54 dependent transcriptional regulator [Gemmatimonadales bacterium]|jgi:two-component system nitrogen regulation response regulator NtrX